LERIQKNKVKMTEDRGRMRINRESAVVSVDLGLIALFDRRSGSNVITNLDNLKGFHIILKEIDSSKRQRVHKRGIN